MLIISHSSTKVNNNNILINNNTDAYEDITHQDVTKIAGVDGS